MADIEQLKRVAITANGNYDYKTVPGRLYFFEVFYAGGTGTFTVSQEAPDKTTFQNATLPSNPAADMVITATGVSRGFDLRATGDKIRFTVSSASTLEAYISIGEIAHGRS